MNRSDTVMDFLTLDERKRIADVITGIESKTSGEVVVCVHKRCRPLLARKHTSEQHVRKHAAQMFKVRKIGSTRDSTGVLVFIAPIDRIAVVYGDNAINKKIQPSEWTAAVQKIIIGVRTKNPARGIENALKIIGEKLAEHFPIKPNDTDELPNEVVLVP